MNRLQFAAIALVFVAPIGFAAEPGQLNPEQSKILESARTTALKYTQQLPDFICTQVTHRTISKNMSNSTIGGISGRGPIAAMANNMDFESDIIEEQLTYVGGRESYEVQFVNGKKATGRDHMNLKGAISAGEFGSALSEVFDPTSRTTFTWMRSEKQHGRQVDVFNFHVPKDAGTSIIYQDSDKEIPVSYAGEIFIDPVSMEVIAIDSKYDLPPTFPIKIVERRVEYAPQQIAGRNYSLPSHSLVHMEDGMHAYDNKIDFKNYHRFASESTIHFDDGSQPK